MSLQEIADTTAPLLSEVFAIEGEGTGFIGGDWLGQGTPNVLLCFYLAYKALCIPFLEKISSFSDDMIRAFAEEEAETTELARKVEEHNREMEYVIPRFENIRRIVNGRTENIIKSYSAEFKRMLYQQADAESMRILRHVDETLRVRDEKRVYESLRDIVYETLAQRKQLMNLRIKTGAIELDPFMNKLQPMDIGTPQWNKVEEMLNFEKSFNGPVVKDVAKDDLALRVLHKLAVDAGAVDEIKGEEMLLAARTANAARAADKYVALA